MAKKAAMGGTGLINNKLIYDPLMCFLLAALRDENGVHGRNILRKSEAKVRMSCSLLSKEEAEICSNLICTFRMIFLCY